MKKAYALMAILTLAGAAGGAHAAEFLPFEPGSHARIVRDHAGVPFILALWSVDCPPCDDELALLGRVYKKNPALALVLVSTDNAADPKLLAQIMQRHGLDRAQHWVFANDYTEKLRFEIDRRWRGELPRTYFFDANGAMKTRSGKLDAPTIDGWIGAVQR